MSDLLSIINKDTGPTPLGTTVLGIRGEKLATEFLIAQGYRIILANFKVPVGRNSKGVSVTGEIDVIALDGDTLCFIEVKTRRSDDFAPATANVDLREQRQITRTAKIYRRIFGVWEMPYRYDVVTVLLPKHANEKVELIRNFWSESKFRNARWQREAWHEPL